ncbi:hypothetical protein BO83DRAFT_373388 [Aspergillus eucalypticola CBS 122712]|uniref:Uncharacterized protein n=1 Tax=Aspergillus eucalypticola (strain CBS 122712 / IBT 29274) TaxID=1448314 RepID=A0A317UMW9_ASPEC|nr:uncharacterized protein BO83DRAFT_373388 [Aspergillus eucalypticola CBS 122712]PWY61882.1 hypothetical protein BO83DRAFT_373388 [Aspergillus eucalypticola CBS 122712]
MAEFSDQLRLLPARNPSDTGSIENVDSGDRSNICLQDTGAYRDSSRSSLASTPQKPVEDNDQPDDVPVPTTKPKRRCSVVFVTLIVLAVYSTILSGIFFVIACIKPFYGGLIGSNGSLTASTASLLSALFAKTIELSFVTICVAFLGQLLSRRALAHGSDGVSIAEITLRTWITQPGSLLMQLETLRYLGWTALGTLTLTVALSAMLYTTAAEALVSPNLVMGPVQYRLLQGNVSTQYADPKYLENKCQSPMTSAIDPGHFNTTCFNMEMAGRAYNDFYQYLQDWAELLADGNATSSVLTDRPQPNSLLYDNTTVQGSWIETDNMTQLSLQYGRMVNNITAAYPHGGIFSAARNPANDIQQPSDLSGEGKYILSASVPSPAVNVLCTGMSSDELAPLIYSQWHTNSTLDISNWYTEGPTYNTTNRTAVDSLFGFSDHHPAPVFPIYPQPYNTIINSKIDGSPSIYLLGAAPTAHNPPYVLCSLRSKLSGRCSTRYQVESSGGKLTSHCEDPTDTLQYSRIHPDTSESTYDLNWKQVAWDWADSVSLGSGLMGDNASVERLLMESIPSFNPSTNTSSLDPTLPSVSEGLIVLAGTTLLLGSQDSPYIPYWNYSSNGSSLSTPAVQVFNASLQSAGYASGRTSDWQRAFYIILAIVFVISIIFLGYILLQVRGRLVTDFTELPNLFELARNSPAGGQWVESQSRPKFREKWHVEMNEENGQYYIRTM